MFRLLRLGSRLQITEAKVIKYLIKRKCREVFICFSVFDPTVHYFSIPANIRIIILIPIKNPEKLKNREASINLASLDIPGKTIRRSRILSSFCFGISGIKNIAGQHFL
jgi:hypothetical protein